MKKIAIIDYGMGNLRSVANAFISLSATVSVARDPNDLAAADMIVLPGVGAFGDGMNNLRSRGWVGALDEEVRQKGKPFLGICLGMQLLATRGMEHGSHEGLNWISGTVERIACDDPSIRIPHIGWNDVLFTRNEKLYAGLGESQTFYFVHSYVLLPKDQSLTNGVTSYGVTFAASVETGNICATQFHPEKSHRAGLAVLKNFIEKFS